MVAKRYRPGTTQGSRKYQKKMPMYSTVASAVAPRRVELKYDYGEFNTLMKAAGSVILLNTIPVGSGSSDRVGKRVSLHDIEIGWHHRPNAVFNANKSQWMLVYDRSPNGALPTYTQMFQNTPVEAFQNSDTKGRFVILYRCELIATNNANGYSDHQGQWTGRKVVSLKGKHTHYTGVGATIADIEKGAIYLVTQSYANDVQLLEFVNRIQYTDA